MNRPLPPRSQTQPQLSPQGAWALDHVSMGLGGGKSSSGSWLYWVRAGLWAACVEVLVWDLTAHHQITWAPLPTRRLP